MGWPARQQTPDEDIDVRGDRDGSNEKAGGRAWVECFAVLVACQLLRLGYT